MTVLPLNRTRNVDKTTTTGIPDDGRYISAKPPNLKKFNFVKLLHICGWENDPVQLWKPDLIGGANDMSLTQAREAYREGKSVQ